MLDDLLTQLRQTVADGQSAGLIDAALHPIAEARDPRSIKPLLLMLNDESNDDGMWSIVHAAEQFEDNEYVGGLVEALPFLHIASTRWASILMMRLLNSDATRLVLVRQIREAPIEARNVAASICEGINERDARFLAKTTAVMIAARQ